MEQILCMVEQAKGGMQAFSQAGKGALEEAQAVTRAGLENLRAAAGFTAQKAEEIEAATGMLQAKMAVIGATRDRLDASFALIGAVLGEIERVKLQLESDCPDARERCDRGETEAIFSASYTTEMEREVLRAALAGGPLPAAQQNLAGNDVELF
jgi:hypothetical protein